MSANVGGGGRAAAEAEPRRRLPRDEQAAAPAGPTGRGTPTTLTPSRAAGARRLEPPPGADASGCAAVACAPPDRRGAQAESGQPDSAAVPPRVALRYDAQNTLLVFRASRWRRDIAQRPVVVDVPVGKGTSCSFQEPDLPRRDDRHLLHGVQHASNFDSLDAGRKSIPSNWRRGQASPYVVLYAGHFLLGGDSPAPTVVFTPRQFCRGGSCPASSHRTVLDERDEVVRGSIPLPQAASNSADGSAGLNVGERLS